MKVTLNLFQGFITNEMLKQIQHDVSIRFFKMIIKKNDKSWNYWRSRIYCG